MPYFSITVRAHPTEVQVFEDFLTFFLPDIKKRKEYYYSVEKDDTTSRHLHAVILDPAPDLTNFKKKFDKKIYKEFRKSLSDSPTEWDNFFLIKLITKGEECIATGYIHKERYHPDEPQPLNRCESYHHDRSVIETDNHVTECVKAWHAKERLNARKGYQHDTTLLSSKNFTSKVIDYVNQNEATSFNDNLLEYRMIKDRYDFLNISKYQTAKGFRQLRIMYNQELDNDKIETVRQMYPDDESHAQEMIMDLKMILFGASPDAEHLDNLRKKYYWIEDRNFL